MIYKFVGNGAGIPGLPHEISDEQAKELGLTAILEEAVRNGNYVAQAVSTETVPARKFQKAEKKE